MSDDDTTGADQRKSIRVPLRLIVDYEDAEDFLGDYTGNLSSGGTFIHTSRILERDTVIHLVLSFPGLLQPITLEGVVRWSRGGAQPGVGVEFLQTCDYEKLDALVLLIQARDPRAVARIVRVLVVEDNPHVSGLICTGVGASAKRAFGDALQFTFATAENGASALELLGWASSASMVPDTSEKRPFTVVIIRCFAENSTVVWAGSSSHLVSPAAPAPR